MKKVLSLLALFMVFMLALTGCSGGGGSDGGDDDAIVAQDGSLHDRTVVQIPEVAHATFQDPDTGTWWRVLVPNDGQGRALIITEYVHLTGTAYHGNQGFTLFQSSNARTNLVNWFNNNSSEENVIGERLRSIALDYEFQNATGGSILRTSTTAGAGIEVNRGNNTFNSIENAVLVDTNVLRGLTRPVANSNATAEPFVLSTSEANHYFSDYIASSNTNFTDLRGRQANGVGTNLTSDWWLRSPAWHSQPTDSHRHATVWRRGDIGGWNGMAVHGGFTPIGHRPALWVQLGAVGEVIPTSRVELRSNGVEVGPNTTDLAMDRGGTRTFTASLITSTTGRRTGTQSGSSRNATTFEWEFRETPTDSATAVNDGVVTIGGTERSYVLRLIVTEEVSRISTHVDIVINQSTIQIPVTPHDTFQDPETGTWWQVLEPNDGHGNALIITRDVHLVGETGIQYHSALGFTLFQSTNPAIATQPQGALRDIRAWFNNNSSEGDVVGEALRGMALDYEFQTNDGDSILRTSSLPGVGIELDRGNNSLNSTDLAVPANANLQRGLTRPLANSNNTAEPFVLSTSEANHYFSGARARRAYLAETLEGVSQPYQWWLRSPGNNTQSVHGSRHALVGLHEYLDITAGNAVISMGNATRMGHRPALWVHHGRLPGSELPQIRVTLDGEEIASALADRGDVLDFNAEFICGESGAVLEREFEWSFVNEPLAIATTVSEDGRVTLGVSEARPQLHLLVEETISRASATVDITIGVPTIEISYNGVSIPVGEVLTPDRGTTLSLHATLLSGIEGRPPLEGDFRWEFSLSTLPTDLRTTVNNDGDITIGDLELSERLYIEVHERNRVIVRTIAIDIPRPTALPIPTDRFAEFQDNESGTWWVVLDPPNQANGYRALIITRNVHLRNLQYHHNVGFTLFQSSDAQTNIREWFNNRSSEGNVVSPNLRGMALDYEFQNNQGVPIPRTSQEPGAGIEVANRGDGSTNDIGSVPADAFYQRGVTRPLPDATITAEPFVLSTSEANHHFYGSSRGVAGADWWLRSPGSDSQAISTNRHAIVMADGEIYPWIATLTVGASVVGSEMADIGHRPALWVQADPATQAAARGTALEADGLDYIELSVENQVIENNTLPAYRGEELALDARLVSSDGIALVGDFEFTFEFDETSELAPSSSSVSNDGVVTIGLDEKRDELRLVVEEAVSGLSTHVYVTVLTPSWVYELEQEHPPSDLAKEDDDINPRLLPEGSEAVQDDESLELPLEAQGVFQNSTESRRFLEINLKRKTKI